MRWPLCHQLLIAVAILFFRLSVEQRNICRYRLRFLKYWDRLSTNEAILGGPAVAHDTFDSGFFSKFRDSNIVETSVEFARVSCFHHVSILSKLSQPNCGRREIVCAYLVFCVLYAEQSLSIACRVVSRSFGVTILRANTFHLWNRGFDSRYGLMWKESVDALLKVVGFLRVLRFPPTGKVDRVGWD
jgi:hypothetical protein